MSHNNKQTSVPKSLKDFKSTSPHFGNHMSYFELNPAIRNIGFFNFFEKLATTKELKHLISSAIGLGEK